MNGVKRHRHWLYAGIGLIALAALSGCATLAGNVRGDFSCAAPDGICAPSSTIDDRALALISGEGASEQPFPASDGGRRIAPRSNRAEAGRSARLASGDATRTQERVLRIVFQPYIDERGRLHEASAVHAVVARGEWQQQALLQSTVRPSLDSPTSIFGSESLADAVDRIDPPVSSVAAADPHAPDPAAVAAARARRADPVGAIKADVAARLSPRSAEANGGPKAASSPAGTQQAVQPAPPVPGPVVAPAPVQARSPASAVQAPASVPPKSSSAQEAVDRVKADPAYRAAAGSAAAQARRAGAETGAPPIAPVLGSTVKATSFPAAVSGEN